MILSDHSIRRRISLGELVIDPFVDTSPPGCISYGLSSAGYDVRLGRKFKVFTNVNTSHVDPKAIPPDAFVERECDVCVIPPNSFALGMSMERFRIPRDIIATCLGKSTYARCGVIACVTPLEPEWAGVITIEISNTTPLPAHVYAGEGIIQVLFHLLDSPCERSYADKKGRYQDQKGITLPFVR